MAALRSSAMDYVELHINDRDGNLLLSNIRVPRLHYLDRRYFNITVTSMVDKIDSRNLIEWLVYHILLGVEHFYLFDNRKVYIQRNRTNQPHDVERNLVMNSLLRPFLDANLVTLVYFPFVPLGDSTWQDPWNTVQKSYFNVVLIYCS